MRLLAWVLLAVTLPVLGEPVSVVDFAGRTVTLPQPAQRIVALAPHVAENIFSAGAGDRLVGVVSYSNYPEQARLVPEVGSYNAFSLEKVAAVDPDLVVIWGSGNGMRAVTRLEPLGVPVYVSELRALQDIPVTIRKLATLAGTTAAGYAEAARIEEELAALRANYAGRDTLGVFYQIWNQPLQTVNGEHLISQVISLCGGRNVFADARTLAPRISVESVLLADPDAVVASGMGEARPDWVDDWRRYPSLSAVRNDALFFINPDHVQRPTARVLLGAGRLCEQLDDLRQRRD